MKDFWSKCPTIFRCDMKLLFKFIWTTVDEHCGQTVYLKDNLDPLGPKSLRVLAQDNM